MANNSETIDKRVPTSIVGDLAEAFGKSVYTIYRWISKRDDRLTSDKAKKVFSEHNFVWTEETKALSQEVGS